MKVQEEKYIKIAQDYNENNILNLEKNDETKLFYDILLKNKLIAIDKKGKIKKLNKRQIHVGKLQKKSNFGFLLMEKDEDFYIKNTKSCLDGSIVLIEETVEKGRRHSGKIIDILVAAEEYLVVSMQKNQKIVPLKTKYQEFEIEVVNLDLEQIAIGTVFSLHIEGVKAQKLLCRLNNIISDHSDPDIEMKIILDKYKINTEFKEETLEELNNIDEEISSEEILNRVDMRKQIFFTIDGDDSKDLDDAISLIQEKNGYRLFVSIADVSHYVRENTELDREAQVRGTSVYFVDRVVPMLPRQISNGICSLHAGVDRLTMTCEMLIDKNGKLIKHKIYNSIINSKYRMTYTDVNKMLSDKPGDLINKYGEIYSILLEMNKIALKLKKKRIKRGSFNLEDTDAKFKVDDKGNIQDIIPVKRGDGEKLIEEFMILANETVTKKVIEKDLPFLYRTHTKPNPNKLTELKKIMAYLKINGDYDFENLKPHDFKIMLDQVEEPLFKRILSKTIVRSLQKATYTVDNLGHFGLASTSYTHFTSPIRRYPDLQIHRLLKNYIINDYQNKKVNSDKSISIGNLEEIAKETSKCEINSIRAEQEIEDMKKAQYMQRFIGQKMTGTISNLEDYGFFIELENTIRGLIRFSDLKDYQKTENFEVLFSTGQKLKYGQKLDVLVSGVNLERGLVDFLPLGFEIFTAQEIKEKKKNEKKSFFKNKDSQSRNSKNRNPQNKDFKNSTKNKNKKWDKKYKDNKDNKDDLITTAQKRKNKNKRKKLKTRD